jgi:zinc transport system ATP-binding protein
MNPDTPTSAQATAGKPAIRVTNLTVRLEGRLILENLSFTVPEGQTTAIIGPNGAGKSVLLKAILNLLPLESGTVSMFDLDHTSFKKIAPLIAYIPQSLALDHNFPLTVEGLFSLKSRRRIGLTPGEHVRMRSLLELVGMSQIVHRSLSQLSGGQLQRVMIAYSLMNRPRLLILDEPSAGIDVHGQETIYALLHRIQQEEKLTLLLVSHELDIVMRYADQVLCLNKKLLCAGVPREVLSNDVLTAMYGEPIGHFVHTDHSHT